MPSILAVLLLQIFGAATGWEELFQRVRPAIFEVVVPKPKDTGATYATPLRPRSLPLRERRDSVWSVGTAFAIGSDTLVTASHVVWREEGGAPQIPSIRDRNGRILPIGRILKLTTHQDLVVFLCPGIGSVAPLKPARDPKIGQIVHAVGNALGDGIVLREGLLTSRTPEDADGEWDWIRFSAPASPGNSGGPLLDAQGDVLGVILAKSESENLNYALPWSEVDRVPWSRVRVRISAPFHSPFQEGFEWNEGIDTTLEVRQDMAGTIHLLDSALVANRKRQRRALFAPEGEFPSGHHGLATDRPLEIPIPMPLYRDERKRWNISWLQVVEHSPQEAGGVWSEAPWGENRLFAHFRLPDTASYRTFIADSRRLGDALLEAHPLHRELAGGRLAVVSLGTSVADSTHVDRWGRTWFWRCWRKPWDGGGLVALLLPQPCGFSVVLQETERTDFGGVDGIEIRDFADLTLAAWHGTAPQWRKFLADTAVVPPFLRKLSLSRTKVGVTASWAGNVFTLPASLLSDADPSLSVFPGCVAGPDSRGRMEIGSIQLAPERNSLRYAVLGRNDPPQTFEGEDALADWRDIRTRSGAYSGTFQVTEDGTGSMVSLPVAGSSDSARTYTLRVKLEAGADAVDHRQWLSRLKPLVKIGDPAAAR